MNDRNSRPRLLAIALGGLVTGFGGCDRSADQAAPPPSEATPAAAPASDAGLRFSASFPAAASSTPLDGRVLVILSATPGDEPRFQVNDSVASAQVVGLDVNAWAPGDPANIGSHAFGYPIASLEAVPAGRYRVQAVLNRYQTYTRSDGHTLKLPPDRGEGQKWARKPGNLFSTPIEIEFDPTGSDVIELNLDQVIPPISPPQDTPWVKHVRIRSELLSTFWGTDVYLGAHVLLPAGFAEHPTARYPLAIFHGHFPRDFGGWRTEPPDTTTPCEHSDRFDLDCYNHIEQELAYDLYKDWSGPDFPRMLVVEIQHANPYYDDSYAVNSANLGPYGDAINRELIPHIEREFRALATGWSRFVYGGSTGGWEAMATQIFYPDDYNGAFIACPDPIDFRAYTTVNIYEDDNAYFAAGPFRRTPRPGQRDFRGHVSVTLEQSNHRELALGSSSRSGDQWDIWQAVYSPVGPDGYPKPIWDKRTGVIDHDVAEHWKQNYDLTHIMQRDWATLGPKLEGKLHVYVGDMDNYYLNNAVYLAEAFLEATKAPHYGGEVRYGDRAEHCWNGDPTRSNGYSRLRYVQMFAQPIVDRILATAPDDADRTSWRY